MKDVFTYIIGGKAGQGIMKAGEVAGNLFSMLKRYSFQVNEYPSLIRGGHNFAIVSSSVKPVYSFYRDADVIVALDRRSYEIHKSHLKPMGLMVVNEGDGEGLGLPIVAESRKFQRPDLIQGVAGVAVLAAFLGVPEQRFQEFLKEAYPKGAEENQAYAQTMYGLTKAKTSPRVVAQGTKSMRNIVGNDAIAMGAAAAGLDCYFSYPMTPTTGILHFFASNADVLRLAVMQPENELAVANMAIGAAFTGARSMVGTSGGGFCLMEEAFSLAGMSEATVLFVLGQRRGPSTGGPTYTEQADLFFALTPGQGEFPRLVASPGSIEEAFSLAGAMLDLVWRFQTPGILLTEKHLAESSMSVDLDPDQVPWVNPVLDAGSEPYERYRQTPDGISPLAFPPSSQVIKWNSYEHKPNGWTTEDPAEFTSMHEKRRRKQASLVSFLRAQKTVNTYGDGEAVLFTFGSTTLSVREAIEYSDLKVRLVQPIFLEPLPVWELEQYRGRHAFTIEQNSTGQLAMLLHDKVGMQITGSILKYDGRPFEPTELAHQIQEALR
jgi:2-oxoglutarate ferredoxin oxidoreductase subunit alpha